MQLAASELGGIVRWSNSDFHVCEASEHASSLRDNDTPSGRREDAGQSGEGLAKSRVSLHLNEVGPGQTEKQVGPLDSLY